jgi:adenylosuccinate lyase
MSSVWSDSARYQRWLDVELAVLQALEQEKVLPKGIAKRIQKGTKIDPERIEHLERDLRHDVIAFTAHIAEQVGEDGRFFHYGLTSSDVVDTAFSLSLIGASKILSESLTSLLRTLEKLARRHRRQICIGRTHGMHAEPTVFGLRFLSWYEEFSRHQKRLNEVSYLVQVGKLSGAVGCYGKLSPRVEKRALSALGLRPERVATQVIPRDRHAAYFQFLALVGASVERVSVELRHLQRTEVGEVEEEFLKGQKGSSAMPHKKNPIAAENLTGCARLMRSYAAAALENVALWHERDISHSSVERVIAPDATILLDYMLDRLTGVLSRLRVVPAKIERNLWMTQGVFFSGHVLLRCVEKGLSREQAYEIVQGSAHRALEQGSRFFDVLREEPWVRENFSTGELKKLCDPKNFLRHVDTIYQRVLGD